MVARSRCKVHITFDDGHLSNLEAADILEEFGLRATFFVAVGWIGSPGYMSWRDLRGLTARGHSIQSHTVSHTFLTQCSNDVVYDELRLSKQLLEEHLGLRVDEIAVPGGRWNRAVVHAAKRIGYQRVLTTDPWRRPINVDGFEVVGRHNITAQTNVEWLIDYLNATKPMLLSRAAFLFKRAAQKTLGDANYHRLWALIQRAQAETKRAVP